MKKIILLLLFGFVLISCKKEVKNQEIKKAPEEEIIQKKIDVVEEVKVKPVLIFTVQIGAFKNEKKSFSGATKYREGNLNKYRLGGFLSYAEAKMFKKKIKMEYPDAFIQALKNGEPISIQQALK